MTTAAEAQEKRMPALLEGRFNVSDVVVLIGQTDAQRTQFSGFAKVTKRKAIEACREELPITDMVESEGDSSLGDLRGKRGQFKLLPHQVMRNVLIECVTDQ